MKKVGDCKCKDDVESALYGHTATQESRDRLIWKGLIRGNRLTRASMDLTDNRAADSVLGSLP